MDEYHSIKSYIKVDVYAYHAEHGYDDFVLPDDELKDCVAPLQRVLDEALAETRHGFLDYISENNPWNDKYIGVFPRLFARRDNIFCELDCRVSEPLTAEEAGKLQDAIDDILHGDYGNITYDGRVGIRQGYVAAYLCNDDEGCVFYTAEELDKSYPPEYTPEELAQMLAEKLDAELAARKVQPHWETEDLPRRFSLMAAFRSAMEKMEIPPEFAGVLLDTDDLLAGMVDYGTNPAYFGNVELEDPSEVVGQYLQDEWYQYRYGVLCGRLDAESEAFRASLLRMSKEEIIDKAFKIDTYDNISILFDNQDIKLKDIEALLLVDNIMERIYEEWRDFDTSNMDELFTCVDKVIGRVKEMAMQNEADGYDEDADDELEP